MAFRRPAVRLRSAPFTPLDRQPGASAPISGTARKGRVTGQSERWSEGCGRIRRSHLCLGFSRSLRAREPLFVLGVMYQILLTLMANGVRSGKLIACRGEPGQIDAYGRIDRQIGRETYTCSRFWSIAVVAWVTVLGSSSFA